MPVSGRGSGKLVHIDQRRLGYLVNFTLGGGGNEYGEEFDAYAGIILHKRLGDDVRSGESLCTVYQGRAARVSEQIMNDIAECFEVV